MALEEAGVTRNGVTVYLDPKGSHFHGYDLDLLREVIGKIDLNLGENERSAQTVDMGRIMGEKAVVELKEGDEQVMFARPTGNGGVRPYPSRMVLNRLAEPTTHMTIVIGNDVVEKLPFLYTIYSGEVTPREPGGKSIMTEEQIRESEEFWASHALVPTDEERELIRKVHGMRLI